MLCERKPYVASGGVIKHSEDHVLLKLTQARWEDKWYQWNQELLPNAPQTTKEQAAKFSRLKAVYR